MYVIFPATDVVDESYLALVAQEQANPTGSQDTANNNNNNNHIENNNHDLVEEEEAIPVTPPIPVITVTTSEASLVPKVFHSTRAEQSVANSKIKLVNNISRTPSPVRKEQQQQQQQQLQCIFQSEKSTFEQFPTGGLSAKVTFKSIQPPPGKGNDC